jgi:hypothetical protein
MVSIRIKGKNIILKIVFLKMREKNVQRFGPGIPLRIQI